MSMSTESQPGHPHAQQETGRRATCVQIHQTKSGGKCNTYVCMCIHIYIYIYIYMIICVYTYIYIYIERERHRYRYRRRYRYRYRHNYRYRYSTCARPWHERVNECPGRLLPKQAETSERLEYETELYTYPPINAYSI